MSGATKFRIDPPRRPRGNRFPMTALADAMFQLLIFFMLASSLTPYSLLPLQSGAAPAEASNAGASGENLPQLAQDIPTDAVIWSVGAQVVTIQTQPFGFDRLGALAQGLGSPAAPADVVILVSDEASVQDLATVLEALRLGDVGSVRIATGGA